MEFESSANAAIQCQYYGDVVVRPRKQEEVARCTPLVPRVHVQPTAYLTHESEEEEDYWDESYTTSYHDVWGDDDYCSD